MSFFQLFLLSLFYMCQHVYMFYVPGVAPVEFVKGQPIMVKAVKMTSTHTQLPYEYYSLQFCLPKNGTVVYKTENLGEVLRGDRIVNTPYEVGMQKVEKSNNNRFKVMNFIFYCVFIRCKWPKISTVNCYVIEKTNHSTGIMNSRAEFPSVFNMTTLCICKPIVLYILN